MKTDREKIGIRNLVIIAMAGAMIVMTAHLVSALNTIQTMHRDAERSAAQPMLYPPHVLPVETNATATGGAK